MKQSETSNKWLKIKRYPHIGRPLDRNKLAYIRSVVTNPEKVASHPFLPFIRREIVTHPYKKDEVSGEKNRTRKVRDLTYASHFDSVIFAYYADQLQSKYEDFIEKEGLNDVVVAYRKIRRTDGKGNKCNIDIAGDVFQYVRKKIELGNEVAVITFDIKGFFDNLDHSILKKQWKNLLNVDELPKDVYTVFKNATKFSYIKEDCLFNLYKDKILCESNGGIIERKMKALQYMRSRNAVAFCEKKELPELRKKGYIQTNTLKKGIPQGLPISAVLANVYMSEFDKDIKAKVYANNGIYKRYSDDIIVVCPIDKSCELRDYIISRIKNPDILLEIQPQKTNLYEIHKIFDKIYCFHEKEGINRKIEYLGFSFDGEHILIKSSGVGKYYYKMCRAKRRHKKWAISINNTTQGDVFEHPMYKRYSRLGSKRHYIRIRKERKFIKTKHKTYGNYLSYVYNASERLNEKGIKNQLRRNLYKLKKSIKEIHFDVKRVLNAKRRIK